MAYVIFYFDNLLIIMIIYDIILIGADSMTIIEYSDKYLEDMENLIRVYCQNSASYVDVPLGTSLLELSKSVELKLNYTVLAAYVNNRLKELNFRIFKPLTVRFIDITHYEGYRVYQRTISFILQKAVRDLYGERKFYIRHSLGRGFYCEFADGKLPSQQELGTLRERMQQIIDALLEKFLLVQVAALQNIFRHL